MAIFKISEEQRRALNCSINEVDSANDTKQQITVNTNGRSSTETLTQLNQSGVDTNNKNLDVKINNTPKPAENSGRVITKAQLSENRRKALNAKSKMYSFGDFIRKK